MRSRSCGQSLRTAKRNDDGGETRRMGDLQVGQNVLADPVHGTLVTDIVTGQSERQEVRNASAVSVASFSLMVGWLSSSTSCMR